MTVDFNALEPTHTCFDDALDLIVDIVKENPRLGPSDELQLVHAICKAPTGELFAHAWVEYKEMCIFAGILNGIKTYFQAAKDEYYLNFAVGEHTKYAVKDAILMNWKHGTYGPWEEKYERLCGDKKQVFS